MMNIRKLHQAASAMSTSEGLVKLVITIIFVPFPILAATLGGFWLDYFKLNTFPILTVGGAVLGSVLASIGVYQIIIYGHGGVK